MNTPQTASVALPMEKPSAAKVVQAHIRAVTDGGLRASLERFLTSSALKDVVLRH